MRTRFDPAQLSVPLLMAGLLLTSCGGPAGSERPPDVILIVVDTLRADRLAAYGYERATSPWMDDRAGAGAIFEDVTAQSSWTLPSMVSLFSGRYLTAYRDELDPQVPALAEGFRAVGYKTIGVVGNVLVNEEAGFDRGFDHFDARRALRSTEGQTRARNLDELANDLWDPLLGLLAPGADGERAPIFLYLHPFDPHAPYFTRPGDDAVLPPMESAPLAPEGWHATQLAAAGLQPPPEDPGWSAELRAITEQRGRYDQEVLWTNAMLAEVFERLEEEGVLDNAVVALVSDHGEGLWDRARAYPADKRPDRPRDFFYQEHGFDLSQEALHTPMLIWGAGVPAGRRISEAVENIDLFPTLYELAGVPLPSGLHGQSLVPLLEDDGSWTPKQAVFSYALVGGMTREPSSGLKFTSPTAYEHELRQTPAQLYDLDTDPLERSDLSDERPEDAARLFALLESWRARYPTRSSVTMASERNPDMGDLGYADEHSARGDEALIPPGGE